MNREAVAENVDPLAAPILGPLADPGPEPEAELAETIVSAPEPVAHRLTSADSLP
jgi:hypothetical protein